MIRLLTGETFKTNEELTKYYRTNLRANNNLPKNGYFCIKCKKQEITYEQVMVNSECGC